MIVCKRSTIEARKWTFKSNLKLSMPCSTTRSNGAMPKRQRHSSWIGVIYRRSGQPPFSSAFGCTADVFWRGHDLLFVAMRRHCAGLKVGSVGVPAFCGHRPEVQWPFTAQLQGKQCLGPILTDDRQWQICAIQCRVICRCHILSLVTAQEAYMVGRHSSSVATSSIGVVVVFGATTMIC